VLDADLVSGLHLLDPVIIGYKIFMFLMKKSSIVTFSSLHYPDRAIDALSYSNDKIEGISASLQFYSCQSSLCDA
jgi:hypothetical protein